MFTSFYFNNINYYINAWQEAKSVSLQYDHKLIIKNINFYFFAIIWTGFQTFPSQKWLS